MSQLEVMAIVFIVSVSFYIFYQLLKAFKQENEESLARCLKIIVNASKLGESVESTLNRVVTMKHEPASKLFKQVLSLTKQGRSFEEALAEVTKKCRS